MADQRKIRVMVVDDSVVVRRVLCDIIAADPDLEVAGTAENGVRALARLADLNPDLITLDIEMPELDGLDTLVAIRKRLPRLPVIMCSTLTARGAAATIDALTRGASDYVTKPSNTGSMAEARQVVRDELIPKIKALCARVGGGRPPGSGLRPMPAGAAGGAAPHPPASGVRTLPLTFPAAGPPAASWVRNHPPRTGTWRVDVVVIGVSTGGPNALAHLLPALPPDLPVPVLVVQHMPPLFTAQLAARLAKASRLPIREAAGGERLSPGQVWVAPGGYHLEVAPGAPGWALRLQTEAAENSCRPAADVLFRTAVAAYAAGVLGVVLTGMGHDGLKGCEAIRAAGGQVLAQDEATSVVWGMPGSVARAGLADKVLPLDQLAADVARRVRVGR